jgi:hypothetical protein
MTGPIMSKRLTISLNLGIGLGSGKVRHSERSEQSLGFRGKIRDPSLALGDDSGALGMTVGTLGMPFYGVTAARPA